MCSRAPLTSSSSPPPHARLLAARTTTGPVSVAVAAPAEAAGPRRLPGLATHAPSPPLAAPPPRPPARSRGPLLHALAHLLRQRLHHARARDGGPARRGGAGVEEEVLSRAGRAVLVACGRGRRRGDRGRRQRGGGGGRWRGFRRTQGVRRRARRSAAGRRKTTIIRRHGAASPPRVCFRGRWHRRSVRRRRLPPHQQPRLCPFPNHLRRRLPTPRRDGLLRRHAIIFLPKVVLPRPAA